MAEKRESGCPFRKWHWNNGGPDYKCTINNQKNVSCEDHYSDYYYDADKCNLRREQK